MARVRYEITRVIRSQQATGADAKPLASEEERVPVPCRALKES